MSTFRSSKALEQRIAEIAARVFILDSISLTVFSSASLQQKILNLLHRIEALETGASIAFVSSPSMSLEQRVTDLLERLESLEGADGGGGGGTSAAVHFDGATYLYCADFVTPTTRVLSVVFWVKAGHQDQACPLFIADYGGNNTSRVQFNADDENGQPTLELDAYNAAGDSDVGGYADVTVNVWSCFIMCATTDQASPGNSAVIYRGDVSVLEFPQDFGAPFDISISGPMRVGGFFGINFIGDLAVVRIMPGVSLLTAGDISEETRRLFIDVDGKPVDPSVATAALNIPAEDTILFSGDAASWAAQAVVQGFTITGVLTDAVGP